MLLRLLLGILLFLLALIAASFWVGDAFEPMAAAHPAFKNMLQGNSLSFEHQVIGYLMGIGIGLVMALSVLAGLQRSNKYSPARHWMIIGFSSYAIVYSLFVVYNFQYQSGLTEGSFGGFPTPTAWMLYGLWPFPLVFVAMFIYKFDEWFVNEKDLAAFRQKMQTGFPDKEEDN